MAYQRRIDTDNDANDDDFKFVLALLSWACATHPQGFEPLGKFLQKAEERRQLEEAFQNSPDGSNQ